MGIEEVANIIGKIAGGFEEACIKCLHENSDIIILAISEQLYCGLDGDGNYLTPTYDDDPYFDDPESSWYKRNEAYKAWKRGITPPQFGTMLGLSPRPDEVPNLFIDGTFHGEINAQIRKDGLLIDPGHGNGPAIVEKYEAKGAVILDIGPTSTRYFNEEFMLPSIDVFFKDCGYK